MQRRLASNSAVFRPPRPSGHRTNRSLGPTDHPCESRTSPSRDGDGRARIAEAYPETRSFDRTTVLSRLFSRAGGRPGFRICAIGPRVSTPGTACRYASSSTAVGLQSPPTRSQAFLLRPPSVLFSPYWYRAQRAGAFLRCPARSSPWSSASAPRPCSWSHFRGRRLRFPTSS